MRGQMTARHRNDWVYRRLTHHPRCRAVD